MLRRARASIALLALLAVVVSLAGCDTTADKNQRAAIFAKRSLATRERVVVRHPDPRISVRQVQKVGRGRRALVVVRLSNTSDAVLTDLPINVRAGGKEINRGPNLGYLANHVAAIGGGQTTVWILPSGHPVPGGRLTAVVGAPATKLQAGGTMPTLTTDLFSAEGPGKHPSAIAFGNLKNAAGPSQYRVDVYVTARSGGSYTAAGIGHVFRLPNGATQHFSVQLVGDASGADLSVATAPAVVTPG